MTTQPILHEKLPKYVAQAVRLGGIYIKAKQDTAVPLLLQL